MGNYNASCHYGQCQLSKDNRKYVCQVIFFIISIGILLKNRNDFSFLSIFLFVAPIMVDILTTDLKKSKTCTAIRWIFGFLNAVLLIGCFFGFANVIIDSGDYFTLLSTFMFFGGISIKKEGVALALAIDILVPVVFFFGVPSQATLRMLEDTERIAERKGVKHG